MLKRSILTLALSMTLYVPSSFADSITNIGIKSNLIYHNLSNCRFGSALQLSATSDKTVILPPNNTKYSKTVGLRSSTTELPDSYLASKIEFDDGNMKKVFQGNVAYSSENRDKYPALLFEDLTVTEFVGTMARHYDYNVGLTLFSTLPAGVNPATIYNKGEVNFSFRMSGGEGMIECDIYSNDGDLIGLIDFTTESSDGDFKTLPYGDNDSEKKENQDLLKSFSITKEKAHSYDGDYPKKRIMLTLSDRNVSTTPAKQKEEKPTTASKGVGVGYFSEQTIVTNATQKYTFSNCHRHGTHGDWKDFPDSSDIIGPGDYFTLKMKSKGNGIQGETRCDVSYQIQDGDLVKMGKLFVEMSNDGTAFALFPFINDKDTAEKLKHAKYQYKLHVENDGNFSLRIKS
jgi:hypothetical protein